MNREQIIADGEEEYGVQLPPNFESDALCDGDTCRHSECHCWEAFRSDVDDCLEELWHQKRLRGSVEVGRLSDWLRECRDQSLPVFIDGRAVNEVYAQSDLFIITTKEVDDED